MTHAHTTLALALTQPTAVVYAQTPDGSDLAKAVGAAARAEFTAPALLDRVHERPGSGRPLRLLEDLHVRLQAQQSSSQGETALGFAFDFAKPIGTSETPESESFDLVARGNVAFDSASNPDDFTTVMLRARWFGSTMLGDDEKSRSERVAEFADPTAEELAELDSGSSDVGRLTRAWAEKLERTLPTEVVWDGELHAGLETNQTFGSRQMVFGLSTGVRPIAWNPEAALSRWNPFDVPAAALRWLAGEPFRTSGRAWPTFVAGLDVVDASSNDLRGAVTNDESYLRARLEAATRSRAFTLGGEELHFTAAWRFFQELDAPAGARQADIDTTSHLALGLELPHGFELVYSAGRMPLDDQDDSVFAIGYHLDF